MAACPDCEHLAIGYGAPPRWCDKHWQEDHPNGVRIETRLLEVDYDLLRAIIGEKA